MKKQFVSTAFLNCSYFNFNFMIHVIPIVYANTGRTNASNLLVLAVLYLPDLVERINLDLSHFK